MINSTRVAYEFDSLLPVICVLNLLKAMKVSIIFMLFKELVKKQQWNYIIRNHDLQQAKKQCQEFIDIVEFLNKKIWLSNY